MTKYDEIMVAERITISIDKELVEALRAAAAEDNSNVSAWTSEAIRSALNNRGLRAVMADWEAEHGAFTEDELGRAKGRLGR